MHSKTGRPINVGDQVVWNDGSLPRAGVVTKTTPGATTCNLMVLQPGHLYTACVTASKVVHIEDALNAPAYVPPAEPAPAS
jgi:hypothetical protein